MKKEINVCKRCIMNDSSDETIVFDSQGYCNYCTEALTNKNKEYFPNEEGKKKLEALVAQMKEEGKGRKYDCIMGISGGLDSSYLAYIGYQYDLRTLAVHIDDGYDTEVSKSNVKKLVEKTGFDFKVVTPDAEQFNALTLAFMKAGVPNIAMPQDDVLFAFLYDQMKENNIRYFVSGLNFSTECILQRGNTHKYTDVTNIMDINKRFGTLPTDKLKFLSTTKRSFERKVMGVKTVTPLNYVDYNRDRAFKELNDFCRFEYYGRKHLENILTAFIQLRWFPEKFGVDKRTSHLSSMIVSGQMTREEALKEYEEPIYDEETMNEYCEIIARNLHISRDELEELIKAPAHQHEEYKVEDDTLEYKISKKASSVIK